MTPATRNIILRVIAAALLAGIGALGIQNGMDDMMGGDEKTALQQSVNIGGLIYGLLGLAAGAGVLLRRRWGYILSIAWGVVVTYTGGMASHAYGGTPAMTTALAAIATAVIAGAVIMLANLGTRNR